ncbi:uncharacterized protein BT62DRAFT_1012651 [Guyanagaster necrorhizus]|uniref:Uncharacterized protein n=1 Tax=Guyanagaster necrorhizus TaxID=856835 RepID=A0A9P7VHF1_9AGAR|nr:uncharacterized protein BT62DRAFT_1012651 [Guyanagaster necrorhizus MCA 3950]KAG7440430.1 hypothetical protein BT62DRAFT_1012651 [Guyanagaster necrorhizus MCA 3950]
MLDKARWQTNSARTLLSLSKSSISAMTSPSRASFLETPVARSYVAPSNQLRKNLRMIPGTHDGGCEVLYGGAGLLYGLLRLRKYELASDRDIELVVSSIMTRRRFGASIYQDSIPNQQNLRYLCAAHGVAGILQIILAYPLDVLDPYISDVLSTVECLVGCQDEEGNWPTKAPRWCHGATGIVILLSTLLKSSSKEPQVFHAHTHLLNNAMASIRKGTSLVYRYGFLLKGVGDSDHGHNSEYYLARLATSCEKLTENGKMGVLDRLGNLYMGYLGCAARGKK